MSAMIDVEPVESSTTGRKASRITPWVEKYRPEKVDDVSYQNEVVSTLRSGIETGIMPHLLFYGPPGTGKTTTMLALARSLYGPELYRSRVLELNASDERGIKIVREKIKTFAQGAVGTQKTPGYPCPRFKFIILDEADTMTPDAQSALRRVIEQYARVTRFCLICNYVTRIIEPLSSRCSKFRFKSLTPESMVNRLNFIATSEGVRLAEGALATIMHAANGDMRKAVTYLQSAHQLSGEINGLVTSAAVVEMSGAIPDDVLLSLWTAMQSGSFNAVQEKVLDVIAEGYPLASLLSQMHDEVVRASTEGSSLTLKDLDKGLICEKIAAVEQCLVDGASETLQLLDLCAYISRRLSSGGVECDARPMIH
jgi:replication factor C subunit 2/4